MKFVLTSHAEKRSAERGITLGYITEAFDNPDSIVENPRGNGLIFIKAFDLAGLFREVRLVVDNTVDPNRIVTIFVGDKS